ncbi:hypothetical protein OG232_02480 [Streptomyces sp. NBC_01411]|uniref:hypothetical protein n=1 Tax=Streptomyces sp. NBC_01411 TaxID=2903857 RepID=UPI00324A8A2F
MHEGQPGHALGAESGSDKVDAEPAGQTESNTQTSESTPENSDLRDPGLPGHSQIEDHDPLGLNSLLDSDTVAQLRQLALLNFGEMNAIKVSAGFDSPLDHGEFSDAFLEAVRAVYVSPTGGTDFDDVYRSWKQPGSILILAEAPGRGRTTTARALLAKLRHEQPEVRVGQLSFGGSPDFPGHRLPHQANRAYVMELPPDEDDFRVAETFGATLNGLSTQLAHRKARLVVLTTPEQWRRVGTGAPTGIRPQLGVASPLEIARRWLWAESPNFPVDMWLEDPDIATLLDDQPPVDVLEIVGYILDAHRAKNSKRPDLDALAQKHSRHTDTPFDRQVLSVLAARGNWRSQLLFWHQHPHRTSFQRNFLVSCSALRGAPVAHVYASAAELATRLGELEVHLNGQTEPGVIEMIHSIDAELAEDDTVTFDRPEWDDAALEYFWVDRPLSRTKFLEWLADAPLKTNREALDSLSSQEQQVMARRIGSFAVQWAVRQRRQNPLRQLAVRWRGEALWSTFIEILTAASLNAVSASYVHEMLRQWARTGTAAQRLATVEVCAGEFGRQHTVKALLRLRHAAGSSDPDVRRALQNAVHTLWLDPTARSTLFSYVVDWCADASTREAGQEAFRALAASAEGDASALPVLLTRDGDSGFTPSTADLTTGWRAVLGGGRGLESNDADAAAVRLWLNAVRHYPGLLNEVLTILSTAVQVEEQDEPATTVESPRDRLRAIVRTWARITDGGPPADGFELPADAPSRAAVYTALTQLLDDGLVANFQRNMSRADGASLPT